MGRRGDASDPNTAEGTSDLQDNWTSEELKTWQKSLRFTRRDADEIRALSQRPEVFPGHTVPSDTLWLCTSCQTRKHWNDFHHANRIGMSQLMCKVCFFNHIPDVSL